jgi:hypothetical protein
MRLRNKENQLPQAAEGDPARRRENTTTTQLGTYRNPDADDAEARQFPHQIAGSDGQGGIPRSDTVSCALARQRSGPSIDMWLDCR